MEFQNIFPFWEQLNEKEREIVSEGVASQKMKKGDILHRGCGECSGIVHVAQGQLRVYIVSEEGREVTLYRLHQGELCVLSASCLMDAIVFDVLIEAVQDSELVVLPSPVLSTVMHGNPLVELSLYKRVVENFSDVMWTMQQILFMSMDKRLAIFLLDEISKNESDSIKLTHEQIARYMGSAREVVTRMLKYFASEGIVEVSRKGIAVLDKQKLRALTR